MKLHVDQPCFVETTSRKTLIENATIVDVTESGGTLLLDYDRCLSFQSHEANLVVLMGTFVRRIPIVLNCHKTDALKVLFTRIECSA